MNSKLNTKKADMQKMAFVRPLAIILTLMISISINGKISAQEVDNRTEKQNPESDGSTQKEPIYAIVTKMPSFPGGDKAFQKFLSRNIKYPEEARKNGIAGTVYLKFNIEKDGEVSNVKLLRGIGGGCDEEAIRVVSLLPNYNPGLDENGKPVRTVFNIPISFNLDSGKKKKEKMDDGEKTPPPPYK
ncbi:MAG: hypothetical protein DRJ05_06690 [Bacteroidetes bacterium]|nr:MAG: hypothetical protein DRJ05_06690 [Bacteroidota bacterium]